MAEATRLTGGGDEEAWIVFGGSKNKGDLSTAAIITEIRVVQCNNIIVQYSYHYRIYLLTTTR